MAEMTPGNWEAVDVVKDDGDTAIGIAEEDATGRGGNRMIAYMASDLPESENSANAKAIAALPTLRSALQRVYAWGKGFGIRNEPTWLDEVRAALDMPEPPPDTDPTPTPWRRGKRHKDEWYAEGTEILARDNAVVAIVWDDENADTIAAAPEMEAALERIAGSSHAHTCEGAGARLRIFNCSCHVRTAKDALAKAKGQA